MTPRRPLRRAGDLAKVKEATRPGRPGRGLVSSGFYGRYHMACVGEGSRLDVAREIIKHAGRDDVEVIAVDSSYFAATYFAPRPHSEIMRNYMLDLHGLNRMRPWNVALREYLDTADFR